MNNEELITKKKVELVQRLDALTESQIDYLYHLVTILFVQPTD